MAVFAVAAIVAGASACTYLFQTDAQSLPERMRFSEFSFDRPQSPGWYLRDTSDPPRIVEFTKHVNRSESQILVIGFSPRDRVTNLDELNTWAENLPGEDKVITPANGHGAICVRYHARSILTVHYADTVTPSADVLVTDEDSIDCIDPHSPDYIVRFIFTQRSPNGGDVEGAREADAFLASIRFEDPG